VGPRNGFCSGQAVATAKDVSGLEVSMGALTSPAGTIPPQAVRIRYGGQPAVRANVNSTNKYTDPRGEGAMYSNFPYYDVLNERPPREPASVLPVWLTVHIPATARPGTYSGTLNVGAVRLPVELHAGKWQCPEPAEWTAHAGLLQSPETLAAYYKVPLWSDEHWALVAKSFRFMGALGCRDLFITALARNHFGQEHALIRFTKADGVYAPDFRLLDRYLATYVANACRPQSLIVYAWDPRQRQRRSGDRGPTVSVWSDGTLVPEDLSPLGAAGSEKTWKAVMDGIRRRAAKLGVADERIYVGCGSDRRPRESTVAFFRKIAPYARWALFTHGRADGNPDQQDIVRDGSMVLEHGMEVGYYEYPESPALPSDLDGALVGGWNMPFPKYVLPRDYLYLYSPLKQWRNFAEGTTVSARKGWPGHNASAAGFTRLGVDYWPLGEGPRRRYLLNSYHPNWGNMYRATGMAFTAPGPDGPLGTARFEMLREGMQELEARITIERALLGGRINGALAENCRALLIKRARTRWKGGRFIAGQGHSYRSQEERHWGVSPDWQEDVAALFELAGEVVETVGTGDRIAQTPESN